MAYKVILDILEKKRKKNPTTITKKPSD